MKLVELLARELKEWADTTTCYCQDGNGDVYPWVRQPTFSGGGWKHDSGGVDQNFDAKIITTEGCTCEDYRTAIVTYSGWASERAKTKRVQADTPLQWRDRIHAIDAEIHELNGAHTTAVEAREAERIALVQRLELEGLQLIATKPQQAEDPSDWSTWKAGDIVECLEDHTPGRQFTKGKLYTLDDDVGRTEVVHVVADDAGDENGWGCGNFKLHTRAVK